MSFATFAFTLRIDCRVFLNVTQIHPDTIDSRDTCRQDHIIGTSAHLPKKRLTFFERGSFLRTLSPSNGCLAENIAMLRPATLCRRVHPVHPVHPGPLTSLTSLTVTCHSSHPGWGTPVLSTPGALPGNWLIFE